ncbi:peptidoglycan-binding protein [Shimia sp.]|uniref:peptidoglycan-binding protein n=1 Tax=Shimia sp. TaxID=1954381 RepID=UPI003BADBDE3
MTRRLLFALSFAALTATPLADTSVFAMQALTEKERYAKAEALRFGTEMPKDTAAAFLEMQALAQDGNARAQARLAYYHLKGIGTSVDPDAAALWYQAAINAGRDNVRTSYAKLLMSQGQAVEALTQLNVASEAGVEKAQALRAQYHYLGRFAEASDKPFGRAELTRFAQAGDVASMKVVLSAMQQGAEFDVDADLLTAQMLDVARQDSGKAGGKAAEALLRLWRGQDDAETLALRSELVAHAALRGRARAEEGLLLAYDTHDARAFRPLAQQIVSEASDADYERALYVVSRLDKNAFVHVLQEELRTRGYRVGPTTGIFNTRTMWAVVSFCQDTGIQAECRLGPLRAKVIKAIAGELAKMTPSA